MSVIVKGMKMPTNCWECRFNASTIDRSDVCVITNKTYNWGLPHPPSDCPITELPPHGRLIDADRMIKDIKAQLHIVRMLGYKEPVMDEIANEIEKGFMQEIANAPTILEAEVEE